MLMVVEKEIKGWRCHAIHRYAKANNKYLKNYSKSIKSSHFMYLDVNICMYGQCFKNYL